MLFLIFDILSHVLDIVYDLAVKSLNRETEVMYLKHFKFVKGKKKCSVNSEYNY